MLRFAAYFSAIISLVIAKPGIISSSFGHDEESHGGGDDHGLSLASLSFGGAEHGLGESNFGSGGHTLELNHLGGGWSGLEGHGGGVEGSSDGDFHHGVSVVGGGGGGGQKGQTIDLTNQGDGHHGPFGGSFVASSKYSAGGHGGDSDHHHFDENSGFADHYSDVLGATDDGHHSSSGGEYEALSHGWQ